MIEYSLIRQNRKTLAIYITKEATVLVKAPKFVLQRDIDAFVTQKSLWIEKYLEKRKNVINEVAKYVPYYNGKVLLLGKEIPVLTMKEKGIRLTEEALYLQENADALKAENAFRGIAKEFAQDYYEQRCKFYWDIMNLTDYSLRVNNAKSQWGSCNSKRVISMSLRLIGADRDLIDYVIVHELAHLIFLNHQNEFWNLVAQVVPDYKIKRNELKLYQQIIAPETCF